MKLTKIIPPEKFVPFMVDIETDGLDTAANSITSVCFTCFDARSGLLEDKIHFKFANGLTRRFSDPKTIEWREKNGVTEFESKLYPLGILEGLNEITNFFIENVTEGKEAALFVNHPEFDISFLKGYFNLFSKRMPWKYNRIYDIGSMILTTGARKTEIVNMVTASAEFHDMLALHFGGKPQPHNAFYDCMLQTQMLVQTFR